MHWGERKQEASIQKDREEEEEESVTEVSSSHDSHEKERERTKIYLSFIHLIRIVADTLRYLSVRPVSIISFTHLSILMLEKMFVAMFHCISFLITSLSTGTCLCLHETHSVSVSLCRCFLHQTLSLSVNTVDNVHVSVSCVSPVGIIQ